MAKLKHPATLICNGRVVAKGVSFAAALKLAGAADIKGAARRRVNFYKGKSFYFGSPDGKNNFAIVPTQDITFTDGKQVTSVWGWYDHYIWHLGQEEKFASWGAAFPPCDWSLTKIVSLVLRGDFASAEFEMGYLNFWRPLKMDCACARVPFSMIAA